MIITRFEWDAHNAGHIRERHGLSPDDVEEVFYNGPVIRRMRGERLAAYGRTDEGRYLTVIFHVKSGGLIRVITARYMNGWERRYFRQRRR